MPPSLLHGAVIPIPKGQNKDMTNPFNYCGISHLYLIYKVLEKLLDPLRRACVQCAERVGAR